MKQARKFSQDKKPGDRDVRCNAMKYLDCIVYSSQRGGNNERDNQPSQERSFSGKSLSRKSRGRMAALTELNFSSIRTSWSRHSA